MSTPEDDLRSAFQEWRRQEAEAAPRFPGLKQRSSPRAWPTLPLWVLPVSTAAAAALLLLLLIAPPLYRPSSVAESLPRPLLPPSAGKTLFLAGLSPSVHAEASPSDFLQPSPPRAASPLF